jgi:hypothetical protein
MHRSRKKHRKAVKPCKVLFLSNIPPVSNNIHTMLRHFKRFGIVDAICCAGPTATIMFNTMESAKAAIESPEAVARNRFIRFNYHYKPDTCKADLQKVVNMSLVRSETRKALANIKAETERTLKLKDQMRLERINDIKKRKDLTELTNMLDSMVREAEKLMTNLQSVSPENRKDMDERLKGIKSLISEVEQRIELVRSSSVS